MPPEFREQSHKPNKAQSSGAPPPEQEHLPCPRCDSTNTKFCYYNNYNFSQPRYFCKSCRRYWTQGGTLRDIPVGGGSRKNAKRSRTNSIVNTTNSLVDHHLLQASPVLVPLSGNHGGDMKANNVSGLGSFTSLLASTTQGPGFLGLGGFGLGFGNGFEDLGIGHGRAFWPFPAGSDSGAGTNGGGTNIGHSWQYEIGESGYVGGGGGDFCSWPDMAISTSGNGLK